MQLRTRLSLPMWDRLSDAEREAAAREVTSLVPRAKFRQLESFRQGERTRTVALFDVDGVDMALVPGGDFVLGFERTQLDPSASVAWDGSFRSEGGHVAQQVLGGPDVEKPPPGDLVRYLTGCLSPRRESKLAPFLLERSLPDAEARTPVSGDADPHLTMVEAVRAEGFRVPTADEWEHACSGGERTLFRWGGTWPVDTDVYDGGEFEEHREPNAFGLTFGTNPYQSEIVADPEELHGGDGGSLVCGGSGPIAWVTFASAYRYRLDVDDDREIWFEQAQPRRALSLYPSGGDDEVRRYVAPSVLDDPELAVRRIRQALSDHDGFVLEGKQRDEFRKLLPDLEAVARAHPEHSSVLASCARALRKLGQFDEAEATARRALAIERTFDTITALVAAHRVKGDIEAALELLEEAAKLDPSDGTSSMEAGDLLSQQGHHVEAAARFERALNREPGSGYAKVMLHYTRFKANGDPADLAALRDIVEGPAKGVDWVANLYEEIAGAGSSPKKKASAKKNALAKKKTRKARTAKTPSAPRTRSGKKKKASAKKKKALAKKKTPEVRTAKARSAPRTRSGKKKALAKKQKPAKKKAVAKKKTPKVRTAKTRSAPRTRRGKKKPPKKASAKKKARAKRKAKTRKKTKRRD